MNGQAAKRIRLAARRQSAARNIPWARAYAQLKREYKALPYHCRQLLGGLVKPLSHGATLRGHHALERRFTAIEDGDGPPTAD